MQKQIRQIKEWYDKFGESYPDRPLVGSLDKDRSNLRYRIMKEELDEWHEASQEFTVKEKSKELADVLYTVLGTILEEGLQDVIEEVFDEVHRSNMSKLDTDGKPIRRADGKILKGKNYTKPDLSFLYNIMT